MRLKIRANAPTPDATRVWLCDDETGQSVEVTEDLVDLHLQVRKDEATKTGLVLTPDRIDVDAETLAQLTAHAADRTTIRT